MSYPLSNEVAAGDPTEAAQYNNLRRDALYLGGDPAEGAGTVLQLLSQSMGAVVLSGVSASTIKLTASESNPCGVMIGGKIYAVTSDLTLMMNAYAMPSAGRYGVYAVGQQDGSFTLSAGTSGPDNSRQIGTFLWDGGGVVPGTIRTMEEYAALKTVNVPQTVNGRLTLVSGNPVPDGDVTTAGAVFFAPYGGNKIGLPVGGEWELFSFTQLSLSLAGLTNELPYDIFAGADQDGLSLSASPWASASARAASLSYLDGVLVSSADQGKRYLGTIAKNASGYGEDSQTGRLVWNQYNRVPRPLLSKLTSTTSGTFSINEWAPYFKSSDAPRVRILAPGAEADFELTGVGRGGDLTDTNVSQSWAYMVGIGRDPAMSTPYSGNSNCVPVFVETHGNGPTGGTIRNSESGFHGYHLYVLMYWTNNTVYPTPAQPLLGQAPGLYGMIIA